MTLKCHSNPGIKTSFSSRLGLNTVPLVANTQYNAVLSDFLCFFSFTGLLNLIGFHEDVYAKDIYVMLVDTQLVLSANGVTMVEKQPF